MEERTFNLISVIKVLLKWKIHIIIVTSIAAIASVIIALLLPDYYKSAVLFYPSNPKYFDPKALFSQEIDIDVFGIEEDVDRLITIGNASKVSFEMIEKFNLYKHYDIDTTTTSFYHTKVIDEFRDNVKIIKNEYGAVEIEVYDKDRFLAAEMANEMMAKIDYFNKESIINTTKSIVDIYKESLNNIKGEISILTDSLENTIRKYNPEVENEVINTELIKKRLEFLVEKHSELADGYNKALSALNSSITSIYVIEEAGAAEKKSKPIRWLICVSSTLIACFCSIMAVLLIEYYQKEVRELLK